MRENLEEPCDGFLVTENFIVIMGGPVINVAVADVNTDSSDTAACREFEPTDEPNPPATGYLRWFE